MAKKHAKPHHTHHPKTGKPHSKKKLHLLNKLKTAGTIAALMPMFLPFVPIAIIFLKRKGVKPSLKPKELLLQVYNETKKKSFGLATNPKDSFDYGYTEGEFGYLDELGYTENEYGFVAISATMIMGVISFLKTVFDKIKAKKEAAAKAEAEGRPIPDDAKLSPEEQKISDIAPQLEKELESAKEKAAEVDKQTQEAVAKEAAKPEGGISLGGMHLSIPMIIGVVLLVVLLFFFMGKK
jgi:hypothetical protein